MKIAEKTRQSAIEKGIIQPKENTVMTIKTENGKSVSQYTKIENVIYKGVPLGKYIGELEKAIDTQADALEDLANKLVIVKDILVDYFQSNKKEMEGDGL